MMMKSKYFLCSFCFWSLMFFLPVASAQTSERNPFLPPPPLAIAPANSPSYSLPPVASSINIQKLYPLSYASAGELANALKELFDGKLGVDKSTNSLIFYGPMAEQKRVYYDHSVPEIREADTANPIRQYQQSAIAVPPASGVSH